MIAPFCCSGVISGDLTKCPRRMIILLAERFFLYQLIETRHASQARRKKPFDFANEMFTTVFFLYDLLSKTYYKIIELGTPGTTLLVDI